MTQPMPSRPPSGGVNGGRVDSQSFTIENDAQGRPQRGYRVYFTTGKGANGSVFIPESQYLPQNVLAAARAAAAALDEVHGAAL
jgi:hypothetical protein